MMAPSSRDSADLADLAWRAWTDLGVPGWKGTPLNWVIDPEALLLLTAGLGPRYPRLWLNALDWIAGHPNEIAIDRVRNLHKSWPSLDHWTEFSGVLAANTSDKWPDAGPPDLMKLPRTSRLTVEGPSALALRLRKALGVSAHAEVIRVFLAYPEDTRLTVLEIAEEIAYTKRTAANVVGRMLASGLLDQRKGRYASSVALRKHHALAEVFGPLPNEQPSFLFAVRGIWQLMSILESAEKGAPAVRSIEARRGLQLATNDLVRAGFEPPSLTPESDAWEPTALWTSSILDDILQRVTPVAA